MIICLLSPIQLPVGFIAEDYGQLDRVCDQAILDTNEGHSWRMPPTPSGTRSMALLPFREMLQRLASHKHSTREKAATVSSHSRFQILHIHVQYLSIKVRCIRVTYMVTQTAKSAAEYVQLFAAGTTALWLYENADKKQLTYACDDV